MTRSIIAKKLAATNALITYLRWMIEHRTDNSMNRSMTRSMTAKKQSAEDAIKPFLNSHLPMMLTLFRFAAVADQTSRHFSEL